MSIHDLEDDQFTQLKDFFKQSWKLIALVLILGLAGIFGWRYWQANQIEKLEAASDKYELLVRQLDQNNPDSVMPLGEFAKSENNIYGVFSALKAAQFYVEVQQDYLTAQKMLEDALKKVDEETIQAIINIRIARLQYQQGALNESLSSLAKISRDSWGAVVNDIRGDILVAQNKYTEAVAAYEQALASDPTGDLKKHLDMKLNQTQYLKEKQNVEEAKLAAEAEKEAARIAAEEAKLAAQQARLAAEEQAKQVTAEAQRLENEANNATDNAQ